MHAIGGYFELECGRTKPYHANGAYVNSGRNAFRVIIRKLGIKRIWIPHYTCPVVGEAAASEGCMVQRYELDESFMPAQDFSTDDFILYTNYFGVCGHKVDAMTKSYPNVIVDNAQAFYSRAIGRAAFYSPRKFFGLPDGGIAVFRDADMSNCEELVADCSYGRTMHLLKRIDIGAEAGYADFKEAEESICDAPVRAMSNLTRAMMGNCKYGVAKLRRWDNLNFLHARLNSQFPFSFSRDDVPMVYPFVTDDLSLRKRLAMQKIFCATYWPGVTNSSIVLDRIVPLPIDQRYNIADLEFIIERIRQ